VYSVVFEQSATDNLGGVQSSLLVVSPSHLPFTQRRFFLQNLIQKMQF